jgi:hypothetical protein
MLAGTAAGTKGYAFNRKRLYFSSFDRGMPVFFLQN